MKASRIILIMFGVAAVAFVSGWAFKAYLKPEAVIDYVNQRFFCN